MGTKVTENYFKFGVNKYFRGNAHLIEMGTYGEKKDPIGAKAYLDPQNKVKREHLVGRVVKGQPVAVTWSETKRSALEVNGPIKVFGVGVNVAATYSHSKVSTANLKLYNLSIIEGPLQNMLNTDADGARKYLAKEGGDGRIVSEIWVVMEAELATHFDTSGAVSAKVSGVDLEVTASGGTAGSQTIKLAAGTTFAYKLHKVKKWNKGKTKIEGMEADYKGMG